MKNETKGYSKSYEDWIIDGIRKLEEIREYENHDYEDTSLLVKFSYRDDDYKF